MLITFLQKLCAIRTSYWLLKIHFIERGSLCVVLPSETLTLKRELQLFKLGDSLFCALPHYCYYCYMLFLTVACFFCLPALQNSGRAAGVVSTIELRSSTTLLPSVWHEKCVNSRSPQISYCQHEMLSTYVQLNDTEVHIKAYNAVLSWKLFEKRIGTLNVKSGKLQNRDLTVIATESMEHSPPWESR